MDAVVISPAECRRIARLAAGIPRHSWIVAPDDPGAEVACCAAAGSPSPVFSISPGSPVPAMQRVGAQGLRTRVFLSGGASPAAAGWQRPLGLLCLPAGGPGLRPLVAAWAGQVSPRGYVAFYGGRAPGLRALGLRTDLWTTYPEGASAPFLLMRRPFG